MIRPRPALVALCLSQLVIALDYNATFVALPGIAADLGLAPAAGQWIVNAYGLSFAALLLPAGRLVDVLGSGRAFAVAGLAYAAGAVLAGAGPTFGALVAARALEGAAAALLFPATVAALGDAFPVPRDRLRALAAWGATGAAAGAVGVVAAGVLLDRTGWRALFLVLGALAGAAAVAGLGALPRRPPRRRVGDVPGGVLATAAVALLAAALAGRHGAVPAVLSLLLATAFLGWERRAPDPLLPARLVALPVLRAAAVIAFGFMAAFGAQVHLFVTHFSAGGRGAAADGAIALLPLTVAVLAGTRLGGWAVARRGADRVAGAALVTGAAALTACGACVSAGLAPLLPVAMAIDGLAQGACWTALWALVADAERAEAGTAAGCVATCQQLGGACGLAALVPLIAETHRLADGFLLLATVLVATAAGAGALAGGRVLSLDRRG